MRTGTLRTAVLIALAFATRCGSADPVAPPRPGPTPPVGVIFSVSPTPTQAAPGSQVAYQGWVQNMTDTAIALIGLSGTYPGSGFSEDITPFTTDPNWTAIDAWGQYQALMFYVDIDPTVAPGDYDMSTDLLWTSGSNPEPETTTALFQIQVRGPAVPEAGTLVGLGLMLSAGGAALWRRLAQA